MTTEQVHTREGSGIGEPMMTLEAFATAEAGSDYFETDAHYRALADRILGSVHDDRPFIVVIGDPPPSPHSLSASLDEAVAHQQPVMVLSCGPLLRGDALLDVCRGLAAHTQANDSQPGVLPFPLFIFDDAGQLADEQIRDVYKTSQSINHWIVVMLGGSDFLARLDLPEIRFARDELTTPLNFQELGSPEILPYLQHQLGTAEAARIFTDDVVAELGARSGGDPRIVNRLAHELLHESAGTADGLAPAASPAEEPAPEPLDQPALPDPEAPPFVPLEASPPGPDAPIAASIPAEVPPSADAESSADQNTLLDRLERRLLGITAETAVSPAPPLPAEQTTDEAGDQPPGPSPAMGPDVPRQEPDAAIDAGIPAALSPPADEEAQAVPLPPAAPASPPPERRRAAKLWPVIAAVFCIVGVGVAGGVILRLQKDTAAPAKPGVENAASPTRQAAPSAAPEPTRPAPPPAAESPRPAPSPTAEPKADAVPAPPPSATVEPPRPVPAPTSEPATTFAPAASPAVPTPTEPVKAPVVGPRPAPLPATGAPPQVAARLAPAEIAGLVARGDELFSTGDLASAQLFYERAADAGDAQAALRLGESFDPAFLDQAHIRGARGDPARAIFWYWRARELGSAEAEILLNIPKDK